MNSPTSDHPAPTTSANSTPPTTNTPLALAQQGERVFSEHLHALPDLKLTGPSLLPGWSRATVAAHVACNAAGFVRAINGMIGGGDTRMYDDRTQRDAQIAALKIAPPAELRQRSDEESRRLLDTWAGLSDEQWGLHFTSGQGKLLPVRRSVAFRAREVWVHLVDLNIGVAFADIPAPICEAVLREVWLNWSTRGADAGLALTTRASDGAFLTLGAAEDPATTVVRGTLAQVTAWATGRAQPTTTGPTTNIPTTNTPSPSTPTDLPQATLADQPVALPTAPGWI